ncbi:MAG: hypothetical protein KA354_09795 [Phycisphaerae bacterium]|nr:hypothetical protein [Phycisphaerae bacterium]
MSRVTILTAGLLLTIGLVASAELRSVAQAADQAAKRRDAVAQKAAGPDRVKLLQKHPELDGNHDGVLTDQELKDGRARIRDARGLKGDNFKPDPRMFNWLIEHLAEMDLDRNAQLSRDELLRARDQYGAMNRAAAANPEAILKQFPEADTNGDGMLSREEYKAFTSTNPAAAKLIFLQRHPQADTNGDGTLSDEEYQAAQGKAKPDAKAAKKPAKKKNRDPEAADSTQP